jgi:hypothetical protein
LAVTAKDFFVTTNPSSYSIVHGSSQNITVTVWGFNGFTGNVTVTVTSVDSLNLCATWSSAYSNCNTGGLTQPLTPASIAYGFVLNIGSYASSTRTTYNVVVTATSGSMTRTTTISVTIT